MSIMLRLNQLQPEFHIWFVMAIMRQTGLEHRECLFKHCRTMNAILIKNIRSFFIGEDSGGECNVPYIMRSPMPRERPSTPWYYLLKIEFKCNFIVLILRYGFDFGCIHFVMMSGEHDFTPKSEQYTFLVNHLKSVNRTITPWLIFTGHRFAVMKVVVLLL